MQKGDKYYTQKYEFVHELSKVLNMAKPHLTCEFKLGEELPSEKDILKKKHPKKPSIHRLIGNLMVNGW